MSSTTTVTVLGMTCGHCVSAVTQELTALPGVTDVAVELHEGGDSPVRLTSSSALDPAAVRAAVEEAGYTVPS
jgi:copper chaperone CopZ